jgi:hypothetical protein
MNQKEIKAALIKLSEEFKYANYTHPPRVILKMVMDIINKLEQPS